MARAAFRRLDAALPEGLQIVAEQAERGFEQRDLDRRRPCPAFPAHSSSARMPLKACTPVIWSIGEIGLRI